MSKVSQRSFNPTGSTGRVPSEHIVPWGRKAFPKDGSGVTLKVAPGDHLRFRAVDNEPHNVSEAVLETCQDEACGFRWVRNPEPRLRCNFETSQSFQETLRIDREGTYHLVCPVNNNHRYVRMTVLASRDPHMEQIFDQARAQQMPQSQSSAPTMTLFPGAEPAQPALQGSPFAGLFGGASGTVTNPLAGLFGGSQNRTFNPFSPNFVIGPLGPVVQNPGQPVLPQMSQPVSPQMNQSLFPSFMTRQPQPSVPQTPRPAPVDDTMSILRGI